MRRQAVESNERKEQGNQSLIPPRINILGVGISAIDIQMTIDIIDRWIAGRESQYVCVRDVHGVMLCQRDPQYRAMHDSAGLVTPDGMPLVWLSRLKGYRHVDRVYGPDLMLAECKHSLELGYRHYFYGGNTGVPERLIDQLQRRFPRLKVAGTYSPPFRALCEEEDDKIVQRINEAKPDIVWVGLGSPKQERWMASHVDRLSAPVLIGVGAAFDYLSGAKKEAPLWMQRSGLQWLCRLVSEPQRLWRRYFESVPLFILLVLLQSLGAKRYSLSNRHYRWPQRTRGH